MLRRISIAVGILAYQTLFAADIPGGLIRTAESMRHNTYELMLSPEYLISEEGSYLSSELRYQLNDDIGMGLGFGSGQVGFNFGAHGVWYLLPELESQPAFSVLGGLYFNRIYSSNFFALKVAPMVSRSFKMTWGDVSPYAGIQISPSFGLGIAGSEFSMRAAVGTQILLTSFSGVRLWIETGLPLVKSMTEIALGISYPFAALGG